MRNYQSIVRIKKSLEAKLAYDMDRTLIMTYIFMDPEKLKATKTTQQELEIVFKITHKAAAFRNIVSQAVSQERNILIPYKRGKLIGLNIITEIDKMIKDD